MPGRHRHLRQAFRDAAPSRPGGPRPLADAVVVVTGFEKLPGYTGYFVPEKNDTVHLTIGTNCAYASRTIAITYGQHLEVSNETKLLFAPVIDEVSTPAVLVVPPAGAGEAVKVYPQQAGYFAMTDRMEPFVREDLYVFRHPLHAVTDRSGHYRIDGVPVGSLLGRRVPPRREGDGGHAGAVPRGRRAEGRHRHDLQADRGAPAGGPDEGAAVAAAERLKDCGSA